MGNRRTENKKRSAAAWRAKWDCPDCKAYEQDDGSMVKWGGPDAWCAEHRCAAVTRAGTRCQNSATYPGDGVCGVHVSAVAA